MKKKSVFILISGMSLVLLAAGCGLPGTQSTPGAESAPDSRSVAQHPAVYNVRLTMKDTTFSLNPSVAWNGKEYGVVWESVHDGISELYFARINKNGVKISGDTLVSKCNEDYVYPSLAWTGDGYGVAWIDLRDNASKIYFALLDGNGNNKSGDKRISDTPAFGAYYPSLVRANGAFAVAWLDARASGSGEIYLALLDKNGDKQGGDILLTDDKDDSSCNYHRPSLLWTGSEYNLSWTETRAGRGEIYFGRVDSSGVKIGGNMMIADSDEYFYSAPALACAGGEYGIVWRDESYSRTGIYFTRFRVYADSAIATKTMKIAECPLILCHYGYTLSAAWTGNEYGLAWSNGESEIMTDLFFTRLSLTSIGVGAVSQVTAGDNFVSGSSLAWAGDGYGLAWYSIGGPQAEGHADIYFARLDGEGNVLPQGGLTGSVKGTQAGYYYIRNRVLGNYLTWDNTVALKEYNGAAPASQQWQLLDANGDGKFALLNRASQSAEGPYLAGQYAGNRPSSVLLLTYGRPAENDGLKNWWLYDPEENGTYLIRFMQNPTFKIYSYKSNVVELRSKTSDKKYWELIPAGD
jgi:hypothetical protein